MKLVKNIIARTLGIWALLVFASTMFIFLWFYLLCFIFSDPFKTRYHRRVSQMWMGLFLFLSGCSFRVKGKEVFLGFRNLQNLEEKIGKQIAKERAQNGKWWKRIHVGC
jgi:hypothetical protein